MKHGLVIPALMALLITAGTWASVMEGDTELDLMIGYSDISSNAANSDREDISLSLGVAQFVTDVTQLGLFINGDWSDQGSNITADTYGVGISVKRHFMTSEFMVPYVGLQLEYAKMKQTINIGTTHRSLDANGMVWGPLAGLRYEMDSLNDLFIELQYNMYEGDFGNLNSFAFDNETRLKAGIIHQFR